MKEETAEQLATALQELFEATNVSAVEMIEATLGSSLSQGKKKALQFGSRLGMKYAFQKMPEPSKKQLKEMLALMETMKTLPHKMRAFFKHGTKQLPHAPGGPPRKLTIEEEKSACAEISILRGAISSREAIQQVARKKGVSERTMYRIWRQHHPKK